MEIGSVVTICSVVIPSSSPYSTFSSMNVSVCKVIYVTRLCVPSHNLVIRISLIVLDSIQTRNQLNLNLEHSLK